MKKFIDVLEKTVKCIGRFLKWLFLAFIEIVLIIIYLIIWLIINVLFLTPVLILLIICSFFMINRFALKLLSKIDLFSRRVFVPFCDKTKVFLQEKAKEVQAVWGKFFE